MILPIGHDQTSVERLPWLTLVLVAALVVGFFLARGGVGIASDAPEVKLDSALEVWLSHPYLDPDPALLELARADDAAAERVAQARAIAARVDVDTVTRLHQQTELDDVTRLALRGSDAEPGPAHPFRRFGWVPAAPRALALAAHPFMHVGYAHLCLVLLLLWLAGPALEDAFGPWLFGALCAGGVLASATGYWLTEPNAEAPLIGASGLAAGLLGAFAVRHARGQIRFAWVSFARMRLASGTFSAPAWIALPLWLLASAGLHFLFGESHVETGESLAPSLSALAFGALAAFGLGTLRVEERWVRAAREARTVVKLDPRIQRALDAHARGAHDQAIQLATAVLRERPDDPDALLAVWSAEVAAGREAQGAVAAKRLIEVHARHGELAAAARLYAELVRVLPDVKLDTTVLLRVVPELVLQARREAAIAALRAVVSPENRSLTVGQAVRAAELGAELDPPCALSAARRALAPADLAPERREKLLRLVRELEAKVCDVPTEVQPAPAAAAAPAAPPAEPAS
ncbi:MAG TPA: rhomboid family intramembrane serine protease, partial [Myxococcota bacterium]|nr:rhomboid family intramembrane serine protease [Myxococcota bacterium]